MTEPVSPAPDRGDPRKWWILIVVSFGMFMALLDVTIVNIAMPAIITDLHTTVSKASWVLNSYSLVLAVFFLSMGRFADRYGQKLVFVFGLCVFTLFSLLCGLAPNIEWLIAFRAGQGLGGAAVSTISLPIVLGASRRGSRGAPSASGAPWAPRPPQSAPSSAACWSPTGTGRGSSSSTCRSVSWPSLSACGSSRRVPGTPRQPRAASTSPAW